MVIRIFLNSISFAYTLDMLGGDYYVDVDSYRQGNEAQNDLNNPDRVIGKDEKFKYSFIMNSLNLSAFSNITDSSNKFSVFVLTSRASLASLLQLTRIYHLVVTQVLTKTHSNTIGENTITINYQFQI